MSYLRAQGPFHQYDDLPALRHQPALTLPAHPLSPLERWPPFVEVNVVDWLLLTLLLIPSLISSGHALLNKRDPRSALGWIVVCLSLPGLGAIFYWLLGVNRIETRIRLWKRRGRGIRPLEPNLPDEDEILDHPPLRGENFSALLSLSDAVTRRPLLSGNRLDMLCNGEEAYPAMLAAIAAARHSVYLSTYIFDTDESGRRFVAALGAAVARGVDVRVQVDALGERYGWPPATRLLRAVGARTARFLPFSLTNRGLHVNLRNHRKLLIIDGSVGFTGGMNIGDRHLVELAAPRRVVDLHFKVSGPVVGQMQEAFLEDWYFTTGEPVEELPPYPPPLADGSAWCRGISAGPNEDFEKLVWIVLGALNAARRRICIMTPYFIPDRALIAALDAAALRGVEVDIVLPEKNNLPYVGWAARAYFWELLERGTRIHYQPPPFVHSKLLLIDDRYALVGSANLDPRSLRLNFEFNLEVFDRIAVTRLTEYFDAARARSRQVTLAAINARPLPIKLRDGLAKLLSPYL